MKPRKPLSKLTRRKFVKSTALAAGALSGGALGACSDGRSTGRDPVYYSLPVKDYDTADPTTGLLFSQLGYDPAFPVRIMVRMPEKELLPRGAECRLVPCGGEKEYVAPCTYWGEVWQSHWWVAGFTGIREEGQWTVEVTGGGKVLFRDGKLSVAGGILREKTLVLSSVDILERRVHFTKVGAGWQDAGTLWVESPAQSAMVISLEEIIEKEGERLDQPFMDRLYKQVTVGCDYLVMLAGKARELGHPPGAMSHDLHGHEKDILPHDAMKAVIALYRAARLLPGSYAARKKSYLETAELSFSWLLNQARPMGDYGLSRFQRGLAEDTPIPGDEWQTRDLVSMCWAALEKYKTTGNSGKEECVHHARLVMERQIPEERAENGYHGHFLEYGSMPHSEKAWAHGIVNGEFGADIGQFYPNYLMPLVDMLDIWPGHEDATAWDNCLRQFAYGYLIPACRKNPFLIIPLGIFGREGPIWFCGTFHGTNTVYGYTAALAFRLARFLNEPELEAIAYGNLQWLAGLNAGITGKNLEACVVFSTDVPEGIALPASMICNIGNRWAGTWFNTRGVICNGFSTGAQFVYDVAPVAGNDGPFSLTDEDWIPHSAGWLTGLMNLPV